MDAECTSACRICPGGLLNAAGHQIVFALGAELPLIAQKDRGLIGFVLYAFSISWLWLTCSKLYNNEARQSTSPIE